MTSQWRAKLAESGGARAAALAPRTLMGVQHVAGQARYVWRWLVSSKEHTNLTYDLTERNLTQLAWFVSEVADTPVDEVLSLMRELDQDTALRAAIAKGVSGSSRKGLADAEARYGRRIAWYCFVRILEPELIVETGTDKGLGALVMAAALLRNGHGRLLTIDINPASGYLISDPYQQVVSRVIGDSRQVIRELGEPVDLFLHDSDHSVEHESAELAALDGHLSDHALVLSDNSHVTNCLADWAQKHSMRFLFFAEEPASHWFRGAGVGCAFRSRALGG